MDRIAELLAQHADPPELEAYVPQHHLAHIGIVPQRKTQPTQYLFNREKS